MRARLVLATALAVVLTASGCGGNEGSVESAGEKSLEKAADRTVCFEDAKDVSDFPDGFPADFYIPDRTRIYDVEDRGEQGVIVTGISTMGLKDVLDELNGPAQDSGWKVTNGETEEHDAEANWAGNGYRGRWAIRESATCEGQTVFQVLATQN